MIKSNARLSTLPHISPNIFKALTDMGLEVVSQLRYFSRGWLVYFENRNIPDKAVTSLIECSAIYFHNEDAIKICKRNLHKYKHFNFYLHNETAFCLLSERRQTVSN